MVLQGARLQPRGGHKCGLNFRNCGLFWKARNQTSSASSVDCDLWSGESALVNHRLPLKAPLPCEGNAILAKTSLLLLLLLPPPPWNAFLSAVTTSQLELE